MAKKPNVDLCPAPLVPGLMHREGALGVDIATGKAMATNTWISYITFGTDTLPTLSECTSLKSLVTQRQLSQNPSLKLFERVVQASHGIVGIDASFSIPLPLLEGRHWMEWVQTFPQRYPDAETFRAKLQAASPMGTELKRHTDTEAKTPFSPYNLRHYKQCFHTIHDVLRPLAMGQKASILPMHPPDANRPWVVESCPASILRDVLNKKPPSYKGKTLQHAQARHELLETLLALYPVVLSDEQRQQLLETTGGDALDSFIIAWHLTRLWNQKPEVFHQTFKTPYIHEGRVF
jgi:hypothetical protein